MAKLKDRLRALRKTNNISAKKLAEEIGTTPSAIYMYERGERIPRPEIQEAIADFFNCDLDYLIGRSDIANQALHIASMVNKSTENGSAYIPEKEHTSSKLNDFGDKENNNVSLELPNNIYPYNPTKKIPILGRISAGLPLYAEEQLEGYTYTELNNGYEYFALRVCGDSMNAARMQSGDLIIVRKQNMVDNGQIAVVMVDDEDATVKRFYCDKNIVTLQPQSTNPIHRPQIYDVTKTHIRIIGLVVEIKITHL